MWRLTRKSFGTDASPSSTSSGIHTQLNVDNEGNKATFVLVSCAVKVIIKIKYCYFSGAMLRINAEPSFFTEIFTELKSVGAHSEFRT